MNTPAIIYLTKVSIILTVLYGVYILLYKKHSLGGHKRTYLILGLLVALILPILPLSFEVEISTPWQATLAEQTPLSPIKSTPVSSAPVHDMTMQHTHASSPVPTSKEVVSWQTILMIIWMCGIIIFLCRLVLNIASIHYLFARGKKVEDAPTPLRYHPKMATCSSFFDYIFWDKPTYHEDQVLILQHELWHKKLWHSVDILLVEIIKAFLWFLPTIYFWKKEIILNHEYTVDQILANKDINNYLGVLSTKFDVQSNALALQFASFIKQRIDRINQSKSGRGARWTYLLSIPLVFGLYVLFASHIPVHAPAEVQAQDDVVIKIGDHLLPVRQFTALRYDTHTSLVIHHAAHLSKEEIIALEGESIEVLLKGEKLIWSQQTQSEISRGSATIADHYNGALINFKKERLESIKQAKDHTSIYIGVRDRKTQIYLHLYLIVDDPDTRHTYINVQGKKQQVFPPKKLFATKVGDRYPTVLDLPDELYIDGEKRQIIAEEITLFHPNGTRKINKNANWDDTPLGALHTFTLRDTSEVFLFYYIKGSHRDVISFASHADLVANTVPWTYFPYKFFNIKILEEPNKLSWGEHHTAYYPSTGHSKGGIRSGALPSSMTLKNMKQMLNDLPVVTDKDGEVSASVFVDIKHVKRQDVPSNYSLRYSTKEEVLATSKKIQRVLLSEINEGDHLDFAIRTKYADKAQVTFSTRIDKPENVEKVQSEVFRPKQISIDDFFELVDK